MMALILSVLGLGGIGAAAFAFPPFGMLLLGFGKSALGFVAKLNPWQLALLALALVLVIDHIALVISHRHTAKVEAQLASTTNALLTERANEAALHTAIAKQNAAVQALAVESARQQQKAAQALQETEQLAKRAQATSDTLSASARAPERQSAPCVPSKALQQAWR